MTKEETIQLLMMVQASFPNFKIPDKTSAVNIWHMMLGEYDANLILNGLKSYIATDKTGFAPSIGQIIDHTHKLLKSGDKSVMTESEAWSLVSKALRNGVYGSESEFNKLPEPVQKAIGSHEMLRVWALDENFNESVVSSNFMRSYRATIERQKEYDKLPQSVKELIAISQNNQKMLGGD